MTPSQQSRMLKCLGSLVVAMTIGAVLLSVSEPPPAPARPSGDEGAAVALADDLIQRISTDPRVTDRRWRQIVIHPQDHAAAGGRSVKLAAAIRSSPYHFLITRGGGLLTGTSWHSQRPAGVPADAVHIWVERAAGDQVLPSVAERVLVGLVTALMDRCAIDREAVRSVGGSNIHLHGSLADPLRPG